MRFGDTDSDVNEIAVYVSALKGTGWWYEGGGIYRPVSLVAADQVTTRQYPMGQYPMGHCEYCAVPTATEPSKNT